MSNGTTGFTEYSKPKNLSTFIQPMRNARVTKLLFSEDQKILPLETIGRPSRRHFISSYQVDDAENHKSRGRIQISRPAKKYELTLFFPLSSQHKIDFHALFLSCLFISMRNWLIIGLVLQRILREIHSFDVFFHENFEFHANFQNLEEHKK